MTSHQPGKIKQWMQTITDYYNMSWQILLNNCHKLGFQGNDVHNRNA